THVRVIISDDHAAHAFRAGNAVRGRVHHDPIELLMVHIGPRTMLRPHGTTTSLGATLAARSPTAQQLALVHRGVSTRQELFDRLARGTGDDAVRGAWHRRLAVERLEECGDGSEIDVRADEDE